MPFASGRVSFCRFRVESRGKLPAAVTPELLEQLAGQVFTDSPAGAPRELESGWTTGEHLFDTAFDYEKNGYGAGGNLLLWALRIDTNRVPADVRRAYRRIHEQSLLAAAGKDGGEGLRFLSRAQKREAADAVDQQVHDDLASGKYRRSRHVPLLWDLSQQVIYCAAAGETIAQELARLMEQTFQAKVTALGAGATASALLRERGRGRDFEDLKPSPFTAAPARAQAVAEGAEEGGADAGPRDLTIPAVPWAHAAIDVKDFLGNEFLIWLWWLTETAEGSVQVQVHGVKRDLAVVLDKALDMDCAWGAGGKQTLRGDGPTRLPEAGAALRGGKWPRKANLLLSDGENQWELSLQADRWLVAGANLPFVEEVASPRELVEARLQLTRALADALDALYETFLLVRTGEHWTATRQKISQWIKQR